MATVGRFHVRTRNLVLTGVAIGCVLAAVFFSEATRRTPLVRGRIVAALSDKFDGEVELKDFQISMFPRPEIWGQGLTVRYKGRHDVPPLVIDSILAMNARLEVESKNPGKLPRIFDIHELAMQNFAFDGPATCHASLTNPKPAGEVGLEGSFGPWLRDNPRGTAISGQYVFDHADLNTIKGIAGILSSTAPAATPGSPTSRRASSPSTSAFRAAASKT